MTNQRKKLPKNSAAWNVAYAPYRNKKPYGWWTNEPKNLRWKCTSCGAEFHEVKDEAKLSVHFDRFLNRHMGGQMMPQDGQPWRGNTTRVSHNIGEWWMKAIAEDTAELGYRPHWA